MDEEIKAALTLLALLNQRSEEVIVTSTTADELGRLGIQLPANTRVQPTVPQDSLVVSSLVTTPLLFPDNRVRRCRECGAKVQCRPTVPTRAKLVCASCCLRMVRGDA